VELRERIGKPIVLIPGNPPDQMSGMELAARDGIPSYIMPENAIRCIGAMVRRARYLKNRK
jgi:acyl-CoA synthetase (NDP forming)